MAKMRITKEQYWNLNPMAKELHDYWMRFKPTMYNELADSKELLPLILREGERLNDMVIELTPQLGLAGAKEVARAEIYDEMHKARRKSRPRPKNSMTPFPSR